MAIQSQRHSWIGMLCLIQGHGGRAQSSGFASCLTRCNILSGNPACIVNCPTKACEGAFVCCNNFDVASWEACVQHCHTTLDCANPTTCQPGQTCTGYGTTECTPAYSCVGTASPTAPTHTPTHNTSSPTHSAAPTHAPTSTTPAPTRTVAPTHTPSTSAAPTRAPRAAGVSTTTRSPVPAGASSGSGGGDPGLTAAVVILAVLLVVVGAGCVMREMWWRQKSRGGSQSFIQLDDLANAAAGATVGAQGDGDDPLLSDALVYE
eukprot:m.87945 g.87945  ORF g.87945 m.87945 type:complete len:263 (-) comp11598_c0_seq2:91-879(-)